MTIIQISYSQWVYLSFNYLLQDKLFDAQVNAKLMK